MSVLEVKSVFNDIINGNFEDEYEPEKNFSNYKHFFARYNWNYQNEGEYVVLQKLTAHGKNYKFYCSADNFVKEFNDFANGFYAANEAQKLKQLNPSLNINQAMSDMILIRQDLFTIKNYVNKHHEALQERTFKQELKPKEQRKDVQLFIVQKTNPMLDDIHTGIRSIEDILTFEEAMNAPENWLVFSPDYEKEDMEKAFETGVITVYSSYPIEDGNFVTPSRMEAECYAGGPGSYVYSKTVPLENIAWIDNYEGQYAEVTDEWMKEYEQEMNRGCECR